MTTDLNIGVLPPGHRLHWYTIERVLGRGGFGITYLAIDNNLEQHVALKEFFPSELVTRADDLSVQPRSEAVAAEYQNWLSRFQSEARTLARFDHPNIVRCYSIFEGHNTAYMVMRYEQGEPLSDILNRNEVSSEEMLLGIALPILDGLGKVHELGFVHRDCQPANIYIRADRSPVLLDFGAARESSDYHTVTILVAPGYAPFEQYYSNRAEQGPWTDIYALGATLYRAIAGVAPIDAIERSRGMLGSARDVLMPATVAGAGRYSESFLAAIDHALAFREADRPQSAAEWAAELRGEAPVPNRAITHAKSRVATAGAAGVDVERTPSTNKPPLVAEVKTEPQAPPKLSLSVTAAVVIIVLGIAFGVVVLGLLRPSFDADAPKVDEKIEALKKDLATEESRNTSLQAELAALRQREVQARSASEQAANEQAAKEQAAKEQAAKEQAAKEQAAKEQAAKEQAAKEQAAKEQAAKEQAAKEQAAKEQAAKEQAAKEQAAKEQAAKDSTAKIVTTDQDKVIPAARESDQLQAALALIRARDFVAANAALAPLAEQGDPVAQFQLGRLFREGRGVLANDSAAFKWISRAALQGQTDAQIELARLYAHGVNGVRDYFLAYTWYLVAQQNGVLQFETERDAAGAHLQIEQLAQASALATQIVSRQALYASNERRTN